MNTLAGLALGFVITFSFGAQAQWWAPWRLPAVRGVPRSPAAQEMIKSAEAIIRRNTAEIEALQQQNKADKLQVNRMMQEKPANWGEIGRTLQRVGEREKRIKENTEYNKRNQETIEHLVRNGWPEA